MAEPTALEKEALRITLACAGLKGSEQEKIILEGLRAAYSKGCQDASLAAAEDRDDRHLH